MNYNIKTTIALDCCSIKSVLACPLVYEQMTVLHSCIFHPLSIRKAKLQEGNSLGIIFLAVHKLPSKIGEELRSKKSPLRKDMEGTEQFSEDIILLKYAVIDTVLEHTAKKIICSVYELK